MARLPQPQWSIHYHVAQHRSDRRPGRAERQNTPAMVLGRHLSVLSWNPLAVALYTDFAALIPL
ncbi:hypothetical protein ABZ557_25835 [Streptomyces sp. NPDC019645]|uniref:MmyB family transcriptional regulator n=1 Tax=Streptomyces sp. NPDC019645 TaxID=3154786 RepID=UPI0033FCCA6D